MTTQQFLDHEKDVTRRLGWQHLKPDQYFTAVKKVQGRKKGEAIQVLGQCQCISNKREPLDAIIKRPYRDDHQWYLPDGQKAHVSEMEREGFPDLTAEQFVEMICHEVKDMHLFSPVSRIVFKRLD